MKEPLVGPQSLSRGNSGQRMKLLILEVPVFLGSD